MGSCDECLVTIFTGVGKGSREMDILHMLAKVSSIRPFLSTKSTTMLAAKGNFLNVLIEIKRSSWKSNTVQKTNVYFPNFYERFSHEYTAGSLY